MKTINYVLFVTQFLKHSHQSGQTGGTISNYILLKSLAKLRLVKALLLDACPAQLKAFAEDGIEAYAAPPPPWRGLPLVANWVGFVTRETGAFVRQHGMPSDMLATTSSLPVLDAVRNSLEVKQKMFCTALTFIHGHPGPSITGLTLICQRLCPIRMRLYGVAA